MAFFLAELQLLESKVSRSRFYNSDSTKAAYLYLAQELLKEKGYDTLIYRENYTYYAKNPKLFIEIYNDAINLLEKGNDKGEFGNNTDLQ